MISVRNTILSVKHKPLSLTQLPILQTWDEKREWNGRLQVEQDLCFTDHEHHDKKTTIEKKTQMKAQRNEKLHDYLVWFFLQFCMDNNYSASSKTTLLNY